MKRTLFLLLLVMMLFSNSIKSQSDYYYYDGNRITLNYYPQTKYIVVDSSITTKAELEAELNDTNIIVLSIYQSTILNRLNLKDTTCLEKHYAVI